MRYYIYKLTTPEQKVYVGKSKSPKSRWNKGEGYRYNKELYDSIQKFGWDNIQKDILCITDDCREVSKLEKQMIKEYKAIETGFNKNNKEHPKISKRTIPLKRVAQYDMDGNFIREYNSIREASLTTRLNGERVSSERIRQCCMGYSKSTRNFIWKYIPHE
jgi:hypothetical protein